jgi:ABC-type Fe2+-enterobactin transport system substrate-binding protein
MFNRCLWGARGMVAKVRAVAFQGVEVIEVEIIAAPSLLAIDPAEISATLATPARRVVQPDGRVRHWRWVATRGRWLRVVTEADGVTVHNAFWDRSFRP